MTSIPSNKNKNTNNSEKSGYKSEIPSGLHLCDYDYVCDWLLTHSNEYIIHISAGHVKYDVAKMIIDFRSVMKNKIYST